MSDLESIRLENECFDLREEVSELERRLAEMVPALAPFRALAAAYPQEVDGWLVTHTEPGLTLGDVRRLVGEGRE